MARYDFNAQRLFVEADLAAGAAVACSAEQANYLRNVLRLKAGDPILVFNGRDGEWRAELAEAGKRAAVLLVGAQVRRQEGGPDIDYLFAPLKRARLDYLVQKATEMGVARLKPVLTRRTTPERVNMRAHARQRHRGGRAMRHPAHPRVACARRSSSASWPTGTRAGRSCFCDEGSELGDPVAALAKLRPARSRCSSDPKAGSTRPSATCYSSRPFVTRLSLGPRILRADTAAVAALALVNAVLGDWR